MSERIPPAIHSNEAETVAKVDRVIKTRREFGEWFRDRRDSISSDIHTKPTQAMQMLEAACWEAFKEGGKVR
jgi:hypothetical protein